MPPQRGSRLVDGGAAADEVPTKPSGSENGRTAGSAHAVAAALDRTGWPEVVGSIAGDDTVFVATADRASLRRLRDRLAGLAGSR